MIKTCLIIDNEDQNESGSIDELVKEAKKNGIAIECYQFLLGSSRRSDLLTKGKIDINKVIPIFKEEFRGVSFDLILIDWDFEDGEDGINGVELLRQFQHHKIRKTTPKMLFSGILKEEVESLCQEYKNGKITFDKVWKQIKVLIEIDIIDFVDRTNYEKEAVNYLKKNKPNTDMLLVKELRSNSDLVFEDDHQVLNGKSFDDIANIIENDPDLGNKFKRTLIEESIAYLSKIADHTK